MDPATAAALAGLAQSIIGQKQLGAPAPAFQGGPSQGVGGLLGPIQTQPGIGDALQGLYSRPPAAPIQSTPDQIRPTLLPQTNNAVDDNLKQQSLEDIDNGPEQQPGGFAGFLGGLDKGLQSPSQLMGLGLLSRLTNQNPYAGLAGLLGMGLYNRNK